MVHHTRHVSSSLVMSFKQWLQVISVCLLDDAAGDDEEMLTLAVALELWKRNKLSQPKGRGRYGHRGTYDSVWSTNFITQLLNKKFTENFFKSYLQ